MEEIKCPSCGSGAVRKITEEKYECMACDNLFLVHNLSKEFLKTDEHIENIHQDLKKTIENINLTAAVAGGSGRDGLDNRYKLSLIHILKNTASCDSCTINCDRVLKSSAGCL